MCWSVDFLTTMGDMGLLGGGFCLLERERGKRRGERHRQIRERERKLGTKLSSSLFLRDNYKLLLTPQFEPFLP